MGKKLTLKNQEAFDKAIKAIKFERQYQDDIWEDDFDDNQWTPAEWLIFIEEYVNKAKKGLLGCLNRDHGHYVQMDNIRKIAALCVAAMEYSGVVKRGEKFKDKE